MNGGSYRTSAGIICTGTKAPQGSGSDDALADAKVSASGSAQQTVTFGTGSAAFDLLVSQSRGLGPLASETLDLYTGTALKTVFGETANFRVIRSIALYVVADGGAEGVAIGGAASNAWGGFFSDTSDKAKIFPAGPALVMGSPAGVAVTATTCNLKVENLSTSVVTYRVVIVGGTAVVGVPMGLLLSLTYP